MGPHGSSSPPPVREEQRGTNLPLCSQIPKPLSYLNSLRRGSINIFLDAELRSATAEEVRRTLVSRVFKSYLSDISCLFVLLCTKMAFRQEELLGTEAFNAI